MKEEIKFKVGDRVFSPHFGEGVITDIGESTNHVYPIRVEWIKQLQPYHRHYDNFTLEGHYTVSPFDDPKFDIVSIENAIFKNNISQKEDEKMSPEGEKFHVGDKVFSLHFGFGVVENILDDKGNPYPVAVRWSDDSKCPNTLNYFSENGVYDVQDEAPELDIHPLGNVLDKKTEDAINPSHYKVNGLPEAHEIMKHLMNREQLEGFYWGNIVKYAYRYGRKGDKAETAGKIAWHANKLKELEECEKE